MVTRPSTSNAGSQIARFMPRLLLGSPCWGTFTSFSSPLVGHSAKRFPAWHPRSMDLNHCAKNCCNTHRPLVGHRAKAFRQAFSFLFCFSSPFLFTPLIAYPFGVIRGGWRDPPGLIKACRRVCKCCAGSRNESKR